MGDVKRLFIGWFLFMNLWFV